MGTKKKAGGLSERIRAAAEFFDAVPIGIALRDTQGKYLFVNRTWEQYIGYSREQIIGTTIYDRLPKKQADAIVAMDRAALASDGKSAPEPAVLVYKDRRFTQTRTVMRDEKGGVLGVLIASLDTTEQTLQEERLRDQIALTEAIVRQIPNAVFVKDTAGRYTMVNSSWSQMSGIPENEILGRTAHEVYPPATAKMFTEQDTKLLSAGASAPQMEEVHRGPRDPNQWRLVRKAVLSRNDGTVLGLVCTSTDISQMKRVEGELRDQIELTRLLIEENPNAMFLKDPQGRYHTVNDAWLSMVGLRREQALGKTVMDLFPNDPESKRYHDEDLRLLAGGDEASEMESKRIGPDGRPQWVIIRKAVLRRHDGAVLGLVGTNTNITRLKYYEQELADRAKFMYDLLEALPISVVMRDLEGRYLIVNRTWERYFGIPREHALGKLRREFPGWDKRTLDAEMQEIDRLDRESIARGPGYVTPPQESLRQGRYYAITRTLITDAAGKPVGILSAGLDTTERHAMEQALKDSMRLREEVERMSRHDLKTPLNSVIAVSRLLREGSRLEPEDRELLGIVERAGYRILNMVNLSLDLFRMEQATYTFRPQAIDLGELARKVIADLESQAASKNVAIRLVQQGPVIARAEELLCYSMLANLIKNAVEAEPEDGIVTVTLETGNGDAYARVHNSGEVPPDVKARFFDKYATSGKSAGLGLGTYSARLMARVQEGDITLETSAEEGTTVSVRLGASRVQGIAPRKSEEPIAEVASPNLPPLRVLVVDDDEFNRLVLRRYLPSPPLKVALAVNGRAALQYVKRHWPDFVFLDLEMPVMDGYETARQLREVQKAEGKKHCTIVAISSNDEEAIVKRALAAGCDRYLVKPAPREAIWSLLRGSGVPAAVPQPEALATDPVEVSAKLSGEVPGFIASRREMLGEMRDALAAADRPRLRRLAHRLAGSFAVYGFRWAAARAKELEHAAVETRKEILQEKIGEIEQHIDGAQIRIREPART